MFDAQTNPTDSIHVPESCISSLKTIINSAPLLFQINQFPLHFLDTSPGLIFFPVVVDNVLMWWMYTRLNIPLEFTLIFHLLPVGNLRWILMISEMSWPKLNLFSWKRSNSSVLVDYVSHLHSRRVCLNDPEVNKWIFELVNQSCFCNVFQRLEWRRILLLSDWKASVRVEELLRLSV